MNDFAFSLRFHLQNIRNIPSTAIVLLTCWILQDVCIVKNTVPKKVLAECNTPKEAEPEKIYRLCHQKAEVTEYQSNELFISTRMSS